MKTFHNFYSVLSILLILPLSVLQGQNTGLPVGSLPGTADVSSLGAATYTIPIEVVPGTQGIQPSLSITYNSISSTGALGMGFSLTGLSAVCRRGQTDFHDNNITPIALTYDDRFELDGNRLVNSNASQYGLNGTVYYKEFYDYSKIISYGTAGNGPQYFKVFTDNGQVLEYGNSADSRHTLGNGSTVLNWYINKVTDLNGNYMIYTYGKSGNEMWIDRIDYTGNEAAGLSPYARVQFEYDTGIHVGTVFAAGYAIRQTRLLRAVKVLYKNNGSYELVRQYNLSYSSDSPKKLVSVQLMAADSSVLNPTVFQWNSVEVEGVDTTLFPIQNFSNIADHITIDYNQDGVCDIVEIDESNSYWQVFLKQNNAFTLYNNSYGVPEGWKISRCIPADLDGDGYSEIITVCERRLDPYCYMTATRYPFQTDTLASVFYTSGLLSLNAGDFLGNGSHQILLHYYSGNGTTSIKFCTPNGNFTQNIPGGTISLLDFDGDGQQEFMVVSGNVKIYKFNKENNSFANIKTISITGMKTVGDFNGDGISDILYRQNGLFKVALGTGNGFNTNIQTVLNISNFNYGEPLPLIAVDLNHDGYDDILTFKYFDNSGLKVYHHLGCGYFNNQCSFYTSPYSSSYPYILNASEYANNNSVALGDFNNDHHIDIVAFKTLSTIENGLVLYEFDVDKRKSYVQKVTEGYGSFVRWNYQDIDGLFYRYSSNVNTLPYHFDVVKSMTRTQGSINDTLLFRYKFLNPTYSFKRRNVVGFLKTIIEDVVLNKVDTTLYSNSKDDMSGVCQDFLMPQHIKVSINGSLAKYIGYYSYCFTWNPHRLIPVISRDTTLNYVDSSKIVGLHLLDPLSNRIYLSRTDTYAIGETSFLTRTLSENHYHTLNLTNGSTLTYIDSASTETKLRNSTLNALTTATTTHDNGGRLTSKSVSVDGVTTTESINAYDLFGNATSMTTSGTGCTNRTSSFLYDNTGRFAIRHTNPKGHIFQKAYNLRTGLVLSETDENDLTTTYTYDVFGVPDSIHYPDGTSTKFSRHWYTGSTVPHAHWYTTNRTTGKPIAFEYFDLMGRTVCSRADNTCIDTRYNSKGEVMKTSLPYPFASSESEKIWHNYQHDLYGRVTHETAPYTDLSYSYGARTRTVTDNLRGTSSSRSTDAAGRIVQASDPGGNIQYTYNFDTYNGKTVFKTTVTTSGNTTSILADQRGNRVKISDPDAGIVTCTYNAFGELASQTDARGVTTAMTYDVLGRVIGKIFSDSTGILRTVQYTYDQHSSSNKGRGKLSYTTLNGTVSESFLYDNVGRLSQKSKIIDTTSYTETYAYNSNGQTSSLSCPDGYAINFGYKNNGWLETVRQASNSKPLYKVYTYNKYGQISRCGYGNDLATDFTYSAEGVLVRMHTGNKHEDHSIIPLTSIPDGMERDGFPIIDPVEFRFYIDSTIQNFRYTYDNMGRLIQRTQKNSQYEAFTYDNLDRLTSFTQGTIGGATQTFPTTYDLQGNILSNALAGTYRYDGNKPHAVTSVTPSSGFPDAISSAQCETEYNCLGQPSRIAEGNVEILLEYGADGQRTKAEFKTNGHVVRTHYYISANYEKEIDSRGAVTHYHYIYGANGLAAVCMRRGSTDKLFYVHPDRLGSYTHITDENKQVLRALHFDPWGNVKTDTNWTVFAENAPSFLYLSYRFDRGFTSHEHYADLKIINMNGRLYDPVIARFFSPDNFVPVPDFTQSYNRYSYCLNNPLQYVDPSGENLTFPWYRDILGIVHWIGSADDIPATGVFLGDQGVFTSNGEMRYYHADGAISGIQLPEVTISRQESSIMFTPFFSSARFGTIDDITELQGNNPSNFHYVAPINEGYINGLNGFAMANGVKTNLIEAAARYNFSDNQMWHQFRGLDKAERVLRYEKALGKTVGGYLKIASKTNVIVGAASASISLYNGYAYCRNGGQDWQVYAKIGLDIAMTGIGFLGPVGLAISSTYFIIDVSTSGFGGFGEIR